MSLRTDIRSAYDEIAPPVPQLDAHIRELVATEAKATMQSRVRRGPWAASLRGTMALVAALLVVLIVATILVGGRVWHDWNIFTNRPVPAAPVDAATQIAMLEARPLLLPQVPANATCPTGPSKNLNFGSGEFAAYGTGPAYGIGGSGPATNWGFYFDVMLVTEPQVTGWVLVRARDAVNHSIPVVYVGPYAAGAVIGTDTINGQVVTLRSELLVDASHHPASSVKSKWGVWNVRQGIMANGWSNCTAFQIDGNGFSKVFIA
ncbi:MAG TPA: hypothetical protein VG426_06055 [Candidatus Dormibacteraeota bacterium]|jgi:hypothetical protein|nr:hypothetical protein [Candidatus Dormibacteraeota bacterium]